MECGVIFIGAEGHDKCAVCAAGWHPITTAPTDGTAVKAGSVGPHSFLSFPYYAVTSRFIDGKWQCVCGDNRWAPYEPQPNRWQAIPEGAQHTAAPRQRRPYRGVPLPTC